MSLAAVAAFASAGLMQAAEHASFHLPVTAHWGQVVLEPGDYKMILPEPSTGQMEFVVRGAGTAVYESPLVATTQDVSNSSYLKLREIDGNYFIREFTSGPTGETFTFPIPKRSHRQQEAMGADRSLSVAVN